MRLIINFNIINFEKFKNNVFSSWTTTDKCNFYVKKLKINDSIIQLFFKKYNKLLFW